MNRGFFSEEETSRIKARDPSCLQCGLYKSCLSPRMEPTGKGKKGILFIAEAPGEEEDKRGIQLIGKSGQFLRSILRKNGIDLDEDCRKINAINCRPSNNRTPNDMEISFCRPRVWKEIREFQPKLIIPLGTASIKSFLGHRWKKNLGTGEKKDQGIMTKWRGWKIPDRDVEAWVCPTYHPAWVGRNKDNPVAELIFKNDIREALKMVDIPFPQFDPIDDGIQILTDWRRTAQYLRSLILYPPHIIAFDTENSGLKPHVKGHKIKCASIAFNTLKGFKGIPNPEGVSTSFLLNHPMIEKLLGKILSKPNIKKIGANIKYDHIWCREILHTEVKGWIHDICLAQHIADNREGICSLKFMAYTEEGIVSYDSSIEPYLKSGSKSGNAFNRIDEAPLEDLMKYNAIDSKLTLIIGLRQMGAMV